MSRDYLENVECATVGSSGKRAVLNRFLQERKRRMARIDAKAALADAEQNEAAGRRLAVFKNKLRGEGVVC